MTQYSLAWASSVATAPYSASAWAARGQHGQGERAGGGEGGAGGAEQGKQTRGHHRFAVSSK